ncbi:hypothetical protein O181_039707 [Austropuccinia psidii MF-1]|uniref:Uncharacterized protein n=1 Tax=Austropuccinia psidii MF-1 TaxID=1389203 RepID=A0A9Q3HD60_9BASI|nr:hypothetical protein [Austropuccinia psidii MF-1]
MVGPFSNLEESKHSFLPSQAYISMEVHTPSLPYFSLGTSQDINIPKPESRASSSNHHLRIIGMRSLSNMGLKAQERKIMVFGGMERFQPRCRKIHLQTVSWGLFCGFQTKI